MNCTVVFLVFNRPECTTRTLAEIRRAQPMRLLVVADGPRDGRPEDLNACIETRKVISDGIDWPCEVRQNYSDQNQGCAERVSSGLNWAFSIAEEAIVIEDDCLPDQTFFSFCQELLERYRHDTRIGQICGTPLILPRLQRETSYVFSRYGPIWGWASWRRAWRYYDLRLPDWPQLRSAQALSSVIRSKGELRWRTELYDSLYTEPPRTWDYQWGYAKISQSMLSVIPCNNLVTNIGFGVEATHTVSSDSGFPRTAMDNPLAHPQWILPDTVFDAEFSRRCTMPMASNFRDKLGRLKRLLQKGKRFGRR
jgi:hypothetical protein